MREVKIAPSILAADFSKLGVAVAEAEGGGADLIHIDVMDGHFVPNITIGPVVLAALKKSTSLPLDVHLMIDGAESYIDEFVKAGADAITAHVEGSHHLHRVLEKARAYPELEVGVALNPATPLGILEHVLSQIDFVLVMSVDPGFSFQEFIPESTEKIKTLRKLLDDRDLDVAIAVDGGINPTNAGAVAAAGGDILVAGGSVFGTDDVGVAIKALREAASRGN